MKIFVMQNLPSPLSPYCHLRRTFATRLLEYGTDINIVRQAIGTCISTHDAEVWQARSVSRERGNAWCWFVGNLLSDADKTNAFNRLLTALFWKSQLANQVWQNNGSRKRQICWLPCQFTSPFLSKAHEIFSLFELSTSGKRSPLGFRNDKAQCYQHRAESI